jgi:hypothetical protein
MVMPLHGQGIDVYEFVEKGAKIDEPLASYIFRQVNQWQYRMTKEKKAECLSYMLISIEIIII